MTRFFEIINSDGAARIGKFGDMVTPSIIDPTDFFSDGTCTLLPHHSFALNTPLEFIEASENIILADKTTMSSEMFGKKPLALAVHPIHQHIVDADCYILGAARQLENKSRLILESISKLKDSTPPDAALYLPALALPENVAMLVYLGADMVDATLARIKGLEGMYLTREGQYYHDSLIDLPCECPVCTGKKANELTNIDVAEHNVIKLKEELAVVKENIRRGTIREYVEKQCRSRPWLTALLRIMDSESQYLERRVPTYRNNNLYANTAESQNRAEIRRFAKRVQTRYTPPECEILLLLPCSAKKPYSMSLSHNKIIEGLGRERNYVHEVIITSPLGVVPRELELVYPAAHYDTPVTGTWDAEERVWVADCLKQYLQNNIKGRRYKHIIAHITGPYREICEQVASELGLDNIIYTTPQDKRITDPVAISELRHTIKEIVQKEDIQKRTSIPHNTMRRILDYQFGFGAADIIVPEDSVIKARFPKHQVYINKVQTASLVPNTGIVSLTAEGVKLLVDSGFDKYIIRIDEFVPSGSLLAPGIVDADEQIRPNDEVIFAGKLCIGAGKARMSGWEMAGSTRGVAVEVRQKKRL